MELLTGKNKTSLAGEGEEELKRQRIAAKDFLQLAKVAREIHGEHPSEYVYQHIEWLYYYLYRSPTDAQRLKHYFDSALLEVEPTKPEYEDREAYCILALGESACPTRVGTGAPVAGATTSSASTVLLTVDSRGLPANYFVEYGTTTAYGHTTSSAALPNDSGAQSKAVALSSLEPCTTYHYQAEAESSADEGKPALGGDRTFTTDCEYSGTATIEYTETPELFSVGGLDSFSIPLPPSTEKEETESTTYIEKEYYTDRKVVTFSPRLPVSTKFSSLKATLLSGPGAILSTGQSGEEWHILIGSEDVLIPFPIPPTTWVVGIEGK